jgi:hypothetical protein
MTDTTRRDLFPNGRTIFYEGDNPEAFIAEMKTKYGLGVTVVLHCPTEYLDEIYGGGKYPMGS